MSSSTSNTTSNTTTKPLPPAPWDRIVEAKHREVQAHKAAQKAYYEAWNAEAGSIRAKLNDGKAKHSKVMMFNMNDAKRERILTFQLGDVYDGKIVVSFQGVVGLLEGTRSLSKKERAFNRLIALRRLRDSPRTFFIDIPETWNASAFDCVRERIRKGIFGGLVWVVIC